MPPFLTSLFRSDCFNKIERLVFIFAFMMIKVAFSCHNYIKHEEQCFIRLSKHQEVG